MISSLIPLWCKGRYCIICISLNLLKCVLWPRMCSISVNALCETEKRIHIFNCWIIYLIIVRYFHKCATVSSLIFSAGSAQFRERDVEVFYYNGLIYFSLQFYWFLSHWFSCPVFRCIYMKLLCLLGELIPLLYCLSYHW